MSWIICRVSMSWRRSVKPAGRKSMKFWWVLHSQPYPDPKVPGPHLLSSLSWSTPGSPESKV